ncbi:MAG: 2Fe-2S iron-sulfur cluster-binding protein [Steroidobacteraceae bacterium]
MLKFHPLAISERRAIADDAVAISFAVPEALRAEFRFRAGQHLALRALIDGREQRRTYSIVNPESAAALTIGVRVHDAGRMSPHLARVLQPGDIVDVMTPNGSFTTRAPGGPRLCAAFASGSGITPVLSIAATVLEREPDSRFQLYYGNTSTARTMFLEEVQALKDRFLSRFSVCFIMSREPQDVALFNGRIDAARVREFARHGLVLAGVDEFFICGPGTMADQVQSALTSLGATGAVHVEHFSAAAGGEPVATPLPLAPAAERSGAAEVTVIMDGRRRRFAMQPDEVILDAAGRAGFDLPFSCRAGVCSTCRARLVSGSATMEHNVALEDWEVEAGYILCCQARPTSPALEISYDE